MFTTCDQFHTTSAAESGILAFAAHPTAQCRSKAILTVIIQHYCQATKNLAVPMHCQKMCLT